jgi:hypothetical protein
MLNSLFYEQLNKCYGYNMDFYQSIITIDNYCATPAAAAATPDATVSGLVSSTLEYHNY